MPDSPTSPSAAHQYRPHESKLLAFKIIAVLLPVVLLVFLELLLRLFGYGQDYRLFVEDEKHQDYWVMNPHVSEKYFTAEENATLGNQELFKKQKDPQTFRLFVLGASTAIGYPYLHNGAFHRFLQYRLMHTFPDKNFEVINLSLTAINTYTLLDFARQLVDYAPDAVLIYAGHNEYYGALGVGATNAIGQNPHLVRIVVGLRDFRLMQLITHTVHNLQQWFSGSQVDLRENLMKRMAARQQIPYGSEDYQSGIQQFEVNLNDMLSTFEEHQIPVMISNLVSNEKDIKPFISDTTRQENAALYHYELANEAYQQGHFTKAKQSYVRAKELDMLRFRAPAAMNEIIQKLAAQYGQVHLIDARSAFEAHSPQSIIGHETLLEHVHPNLYGYALLSEAFYQAMKQQHMLPPGGNEMSFEALRRQMPVTAIDSLKGTYEVMILKEGWPFNEPMPPEEKREKTLEEKLAGGLVVRQLSWAAAINELLNHYLKTEDYAKALQATEALLLEYPYDPAFYRQAGKLAMHINYNDQAVFYLKKAFAMHEDFDTAKNLFVTLLKLDRPQEALPYLTYAASVERRFSELQYFVTNLIALKAAYAKDTSNVKLANQVAAAYLKFANTAAAAKYVNRSLQIEENNLEALEMKKQVEAAKP